MSKRKNTEDRGNTSKKFKFDLIDNFIEQTTTTTDYILSDGFKIKNEEINKYYEKIQKLEKELKKTLEKVKKKKKY